MRPGKIVGALLAACVLASPSASAQDTAPTRGWIGISFNVRTTVDARGQQSTVVITDVVPGSPAAQASLRTGDVLLAVNDVRGPRALLELRERLHVEPGEFVTVAVQRGETTHQVRLRAAEGPERSFGQFTLTLQPDSMVEVISRSMDSLRVRIVESRGAQLHVAAASPRVGQVTSRAEGRAFVVRPFPDENEWTDMWFTREVEPPFEFRVFRGEAFDSLVRELDTVNRELREIRALEGERVRQILAQSGDLGRNGAARDAEVRALRERLAAQRLRAQELERAMERSARETETDLFAAEGTLARVPRPLPVADATEPPRAPRAPLMPEPSDAVSDFRPLTPYVLGRDRAAGAKVLDLEPELAQYFGVNGGVLVAEVPAGTPAYEAGLRPGDVLTRVASIRVESVDELRSLLSRADGPLPLSLIRKGDSIQVVLRH